MPYAEIKDFGVPIKDAMYSRWIGRKITKQEYFSETQWLTQFLKHRKMCNIVFGFLINYSDQLAFV